MLALNLVSIIRSNWSNVFPVSAVKACRGSRDITPLILNLKLHIFGLRIDEYQVIKICSEVLTVVKMKIAVSRL
jgi:hypothetical protein